MSCENNNASSLSVTIGATWSLRYHPKTDLAYKKKITKTEIRKKYNRDPEWNLVKGNPVT